MFDPIFTGIIVVVLGAVLVACGYFIGKGREAHAATLRLARVLESLIKAKIIDQKDLQSYILLGPVMYASYKESQNNLDKLLHGEPPEEE